jgi:hypothetical protein
MWLDEEKPILKRDLVLNQPFVNASGTLGFAPDLRVQPAISRLGAFITNPISRGPRQPAANRAYLPSPGGFLLHSGPPQPRDHARDRSVWSPLGGRTPAGDHPPAGRIAKNTNRDGPQA